MDSTLSRIAENVLFSVLLAASGGWTAVSMADAAGSVTQAASCSAAQSVASVGHLRVRCEAASLPE